jgi:hypothetical protein
VSGFHSLHRKTSRPLAWVMKGVPGPAARSKSGPRPALTQGKGRLPAADVRLRLALYLRGGEGWMGKDER